VVMMLVLHPPLRESLRIRVSLELRYGTWSAAVVRAETTLPRQDRERLIFLVYYRLWPLTPLLRIFSLPAKSMKHSLVRYSLSLQR
jgi:hypothetical protein